MIPFLGVLAALVFAVVVGLDHRIPIVLGLMTLLCTGVLLILQRREVGDLLATIAFFELAFGVSLALLSFFRRDSNQIDRSPKPTHSTKDDSGMESDPFVEGHEN